MEFPDAEHAKCHNYKEEMLCPYCDKPQSDLCELRDDSGWTTCDHCGKEFLYIRHIKTTYTTYLGFKEDK